MGWRDRLGTILARCGAIRSNYRVTPGLYGLGKPTAEAPVLVTANYKLTFDTLRRALDGLDLWLLVIDTRGINVWCAAGKGTFSSDEIILSVNKTGLKDFITHRELILPQLSATGVSVTEVKKGCGLKVSYGPVRACDLRRFLTSKEADETMRQVNFSLRERAVLIPVELFLLGKPLVLVLLAALLTSGISPPLFSPNALISRGPLLLLATIAGIMAGAVFVPLLLPYLPGRQFWYKGIIPGLFFGAVMQFLSTNELHLLEKTALLLWTVTISSYLAMNFTGSTPFTSPSGVEYEMRRGIPIQAISALIALLLWLGTPFLKG